MFLDVVDINVSFPFYIVSTSYDNFFCFRNFMFWFTWFRENVAEKKIILYESVGIERPDPTITTTTVAPEADIKLNNETGR